MNPARVSLAANASSLNPAAKQIFAQQIRGAAHIRSGSIASAVSPLDLRKLTIADFGDVDGGR
jgi:hypothetical protein